MDRLSRGRELKQKYGVWLPFDEHWILSKDLKRITVIKQTKLDQNVS